MNNKEKNKKRINEDRLNYLKKFAKYAQEELTRCYSIIDNSTNEDEENLVKYDVNSVHEKLINE